MNDVETRFCDGCIRFLPVDRFRHRSKDGPRMRRCNDCHAAAERERRAERRAKQGRRHLRRHFAGLVDERNRRRVELLTAAMLHDLGGLPGFLATWRDYREDARQRGGLATFRALQVVLRLIEHANAQRPAPEDMSEEELAAAMMEHTKAFIAQNPAAAVVAAGEIGWKVFPPGWSDDDDDGAVE